MGCTAQFFEWLSNEFIKKYGGKLLPDIQDDAIQLGKANIAFAQKKYNEVMKMISVIQRIEDVGYYLRIKTLVIKTHYELAL